MSELANTSSTAEILSSLQHDKLVLQRQLSEVKMENEVLRFQLYQMSTILDLAVSKLGKLGMYLETPIDIRTLRDNVQRWVNKNFNVDETNEVNEVLVHPTLTTVSATADARTALVEKLSATSSNTHYDKMQRDKVAINADGGLESEQKNLVHGEESKAALDNSTVTNKSTIITTNINNKNNNNDSSNNNNSNDGKTVEESSKTNSDGGDDGNKNNTVDNVNNELTSAKTSNGISTMDKEIKINKTKKYLVEGEDDQKVNMESNSTPVQSQQHNNSNQKSNHSNNNNTNVSGSNSSNIVLPFTPSTSSYNKRFQLRMHLREHTKAVHCCSFCPGDDPFIVTGGLDRRLVLQNFFTGAKQWEVVAHEESVVDVAWFEATKHILSASYDGTVKLWDARRGEMRPVYEYVAHGFVLAAIPLDKSHLFACADARHRTSIVDTRTSRPVTWVHESRVNSLAFDSTAKQLIMGHSDGVLSIWDMRRLNMALSSSSSLSTSAQLPAIMEHNKESNTNNDHAVNSTGALGQTSHPLSYPSSSAINDTHAGTHNSTFAVTNAAEVNNKNKNDMSSDSVKNRQGVVQEFDNVATSFSSVHVPCLARIRNDSAHSSISFVGEFYGIDDVKRMVVVSNDNLVRLYRATLNAQASSTMHISSLPAPAALSSSLLQPSDSACINTSATTAAADPSVPFANSVIISETVVNNLHNDVDGNNNIKIVGTSNASINLPNQFTGHENTLLETSQSLLLSSSSSGMLNSTFTNVANANTNMSSISTRATYQPSHVTNVRAGSASGSNNVTVMADTSSVNKTNGELYYLRNVLSGVPTYGHRVRGAFWRGKRDKAQLSMFFDDGDKDAELPVCRSVTECDLVVSGGYDHTATVFDCTDEGTCVVLDRLAGHRDWVTGATIHHSSSRLIIATTSADATVRIWVPVKN